VAIRKNHVKEVLLNLSTAIEINEAAPRSKVRWADTILQAVSGCFLNVFTSGELAL